MIIVFNLLKLAQNFPNSFNTNSKDFKIFPKCFNTMQKISKINSEIVQNELKQFLKTSKKIMQNIQIKN